MTGAAIPPWTFAVQVHTGQGNPERGRAEGNDLKSGRGLGCGAGYGTTVLVKEGASGLRSVRH